MIVIKRMKQNDVYEITFIINNVPIYIYIIQREYLFDIIRKNKILNTNDCLSYVYNFLNYNDNTY